jgi:hypothetical protein
MRSNIHHPQVSRPFPLFDCFCHIQHFAPFILLSTALDIREREFVVARTRHSPFRHFKIQKLEKDRSVAKVFLMNEKSKVFPFAVVFIMKEKKTKGFDDVLSQHATSCYSMLSWSSYVYKKVLCALE